MEGTRISNKNEASRFNKSRDELEKEHNINQLMAEINARNIAGVQRVLKQSKTNEGADWLNDVASEDETILHRAVKLRAQKDIIEALVNAKPELLACSRNTSELYRGQTVLHIAITGEDIDVSSLLLCKAKEHLVIDQMLQSKATGTRFENTVMLGELPLFVAVLTLNVKMVQTLLEHGASLDACNSKGDNAIHCLIRYAHLYPEKMADIMIMAEFLASFVTGTDEKKVQTISRELNVTKRQVSEIEKNKNKHIWHATNEDGLNPLKLAAKLGQQIIFKFIMELNGVYCFVNSEDGLFDVELYDVTDIDAISEFKISDIIPIEAWNDTLNTAELLQSDARFTENPKCRVPTLEMIFGSDSATVFKFIELSPLRYVINRKWEFYRWFFAIWGILHMLFMVGFTVYAVRRSSVPEHSTNTTNSNRNVYEIGKDSYVTFYSLLSLVFAFIYVFQEVVRVIRGQMPWTFAHVMNCYHNGPFRLVLVMFAVVVLVDFVWKVCDQRYLDYFLVFAMILGWWFLVFFLRAFRQFSFFTVMIQKVLVGDMFRFSIVIGMELVAFTTGVFIVFRGSESNSGELSENESVHEYSKLMIAMFKMMFGFTSLDVLFEAPSSWFAICIYVAFVLLTYVLMINSLIAMMSSTCSIVSQNREIQYRVQQLSIILFFESIFPVCCLRMVGETRDCDWYDLNTKQFVKRSRLFMEVRSLHEVTKSKTRHTPNTQTMLETIFHTVKNIKLPQIAVFEDENLPIDINTHKPLNIRRSSLDNAPDVDLRNQVNESSRRHHKKKKRRKRKDNLSDDKEGLSSNVKLRTDDNLPPLTCVEEI